MKDLSKIHFAGKDPNEEIVMLLRRHKVALGKQLIEFFIGACLIVIVFIVLSTYTTWLDESTSLVYGIIYLGGSLTFLYLLLFAYHAWVDYYLDVWIITSERVIAMDQQGLFHRVTSELRLDRIQDVSSESRGLLPTIFKYGMIRIRTASEEDSFFFNEVADPDIVARQILELHESYVAKNQQPPIQQVSHQGTTVTSQHMPPTTPKQPPQQ